MATLDNKTQKKLWIMANLDNKTLKKLWIARDWDDSLYVYTNKPDLLAGIVFMCHDSLHDKCFQLNEDSFPDVTFENSPLPLEDLLH